MNSTETLQTHNWNVHGHDWAVHYLRQSMFHDRIRQAYLITGTQSIGKLRFAQAFAQALNCSHEDITQRPCGECRSCKLLESGNHPDMVYSEIDENARVLKGALKIDQLRSIMQRIALKPYHGRYRIAIIQDIQRALDTSQDAILKTLEEPPRHAIIILTAPSLDGIMQTIISRCQLVHLRPVPADDLQSILINQYNADEETARLLARFSGGRIEWAIDALNNPDVFAERDENLQLLEDLLTMSRAERFVVAQKLSNNNKEYLTKLLELWLSYWRDVLLMSEGTTVKLCNTDREVQIQQLLYGITTEKALAAVKSTQNLLHILHTNANLRLAFEVLLLDYPQIK